MYRVMAAGYSWILLLRAALHNSCISSARWGPKNELAVVEVYAWQAGVLPYDARSNCSAAQETSKRGLCGGREEFGGSGRQRNKRASAAMKSGEDVVASARPAADLPPTPGLRNEPRCGGINRLGKPLGPDVWCAGGGDRRWDS